MNHILYLITRDDDKKYVGITIDYRIKQRMCQHKNSDRFRNHMFTYKILLTNKDRKIIEDAESDAVNKYDTFHNGLNSTYSGKGQHHDSLNFNTLGYKFSKESKKKMSNSAKRRAKNEIPGERSKRSKAIWTPLRRKKMSELKTGIPSKLKRFSKTQISNIYNDYLCFTHKDINTKSRNGKMLTKKRIFSNAMHEKYHISSSGLYKYVKEFKD